MSMMNDYEEDLDDFPAENREKLAESVVGAHRAESTDQFSGGSGITTKMPPLFDGSTSWFKNERGVDRRLVGSYSALMWPRPKATAVALFFEWLILKAQQVSTTGAQRVFLWGFHQFNRARRGIIEMAKWIGKFSLLLKR